VASIERSTLDGGETIELRVAEYSATFVPAVGMVGISLRHRGEEFLALPADLAGYRQGAWTGLPILHPWANRLGSRRFRVAGRDVDLTDLDVPTDPGGLPIHGTLTAAEGWALTGTTVDTAADSAGFSAAFDHRARPDLLAAFPFRHRLLISIALCEDGLTVETVLDVDDGEVVPASFGWHPYFRLPGARRSSWRLGLPEREHMELDDRGLPTGSVRAEPAELAPLADRSFDELYALRDDRRLSLESDRHRLEIEFDLNYRYAQVFAPPDHDFVCLEPMTAPTNALVTGKVPLVGSGDTTFGAAFTIRIADR
jgi:galactose mutarotase-like enzyme